MTHPSHRWLPIALLLLGAGLTGCAGAPPRDVASPALRATPAAERRVVAAPGLTDTFKRAERDYQRGAWIEAHNGYRAVVAKSPGHAPSLARLGNIAQRLNSLDEARQFYESAIEHDPRDARVRYNLSVVLYALARRQLAVAQTLEPTGLPQGEALEDALGGEAAVRASVAPPVKLPVSRAVLKPAVARPARASTPAAVAPPARPGATVPSKGTRATPAKAAGPG